jgi:ABC-type xylose transport system permease subunit
MKRVPTRFTGENSMDRLPRWFVVTAVIALLWNLLGCFAFISDLRVSPEDIARLPEARQALYNARPGWAVAATALAVFGGVLGCIGLLLRKRWALPVFVVSLVGILVQDFGLFVLANGAALAGPVAVLLQSIVLLVGVGLILLSRRGLSRGWLR